MGAPTEELGEKVVILYDGGKGTTVHLAEALVPESSALKRVVCEFPWKDQKREERAPTELIQFKDKTGVTQVSLIVLRREISWTTCAYVVHELFEYILANSPIQSPAFSLVVPMISRAPGSVLTEDANTNNNVKIYAASVNSVLSETIGHLPKLPPTFTLRDSFLAYLSHYVHAMGLPTLMLLGPRNQGVVSDNESNEVLHALGNVVAQQVGLTYTKHNLKDVANLVSLTDGVENDWRRLYI
jgi:hypothetical protein